MGSDGTRIEAAEPVAVLAPAGDAEAIHAILDRSRMDFVPLGPGELAAAVRSEDLSAAIVDEAMLGEELLLALADAVADQPAWSNFPFILLMGRSSSSRLARIIEALGNVGVVERPLDGEILVPNLHAALRSRRRQREAKAYLLQRQEAESRLQQLTESLEARVRARTDDLASANQRLLREIEERRRAEEQLRESEELYRYTVELSQQLVWTASPDGRILSLSARFSELTGLDRKMDPHEGWLASLHPDDEQSILGLWEEILRTGQASAGEFRMRLADGSYRTFIARAAPRKDENGQVIRWYGSTEDIEDQKQAEAARAAAEERYRLAARATNDAIWDLDLATDEVHWSESASETLGYPGRTLGTTSLAWWEERIHPDDRQVAVNSLQRVAKRGTSRWSATYRFRRANGDYATFFDRGFILRDEKGDAIRFVGAMTDLTERQRAEEEIRRMQAELIHVSRLSAMGTMGSALAHELNQPLTAVTNYVRGSRRLLADGDQSRIGEVEGALQAAEAGALRAGQIVRRLRELVARG
ncbi:MAG TPA: PAS domain-containing protein, partial [Allosphingosinicella sp.]